MITVYHWQTDQKAGIWQKPEALRTQPEALRGPGDIIWIDLDNPDPEEEQLVFQEFLPIHPLTLEDITRLRREPDSPPHLPKVEEFSDYLFVVINPLAPRFLKAIQGTDGAAPVPDGRSSTQLSAILTATLLVTHHYEPAEGVQDLKAFLSRHEAHCLRGPDYLFHLVLDASVDQYVTVLDHFDDALDEMETLVLDKPQPQSLRQLLALKREIVLLRKSLVYEREVLARLSRGEFALIDERETVYYRNVYDHIVRFTELIESSRDMVSDLMQMHLAATSNKLNEIMKALATISTMVLPMTLIAGVYGMNFEEFPEFKWRFGYPFALGLMLLTGLSSYLFFRWKKWI